MISYEYDVYLSFTGADRDMKNSIRQRLESGGFSAYDSDLYCSGQFRQNYMEALDKSRVFLMILSDNLRNDPSVTSEGTLTEVRKELAMAAELEARGQLNIVILCLSDFFRYSHPFHDYNDTIGWLFYTHTRGFSMVYGSLTEDKLLSDASYADIESRVADFVKRRAEGKPALSQAPRIDITSDKIDSSEAFVGRDNELKRVLNAFSDGKQLVVLTGVGGMGKTRLATEIARYCNENGYLRCPQIVHIQEMGGSAGVLHTIVSSVSYKSSVYDSFSYLNEQERYSRKLDALRELPENILLVIDNFNNLSGDELAEVISKLRCRVLLTTRSHIDVASEAIATVNIGSIEQSKAKEMFSRLAGFDATDEDFTALYRYTGGHTITICIIAKMLSTHSMGIDELLKKMDNLEDFGAKVEFRHNEYGDSDTVFGHLKKLFGIGNFSEGALRILRNMSVLSDGTIATDKLMQILSLGNKNDIIDLIRHGWLETVKTVLESSGTSREYLCLHPIISHLVARLLSPTLDNVSETVEYLLATADEQDEDMTFSSATVLCDRLYYAIYVLACSGGSLARSLWDKYVSVGRYIGDSDAIEQAASALAEKIANPEERAVVTSYSDMIVLEQHPTRLSVYNKYLGSLCLNSNDYKWIMRSLSVTVASLCGIDEARERLEEIITAAMQAAMEREDDFAVGTLAGFMIAIGSFVKVRKILRGYVKKRKLPKQAMTGDNLFLKAIYYNLVMVNAKDTAEYYSKVSRIADDIASEKFFKTLGLMLRHPAIFYGFKSLEKTAYDLPDSDSMKPYFVGILDVASKMAFEGKIDVRACLEAIMTYYTNLVERGMTLASAADAIGGMLTFLSNIPMPKVMETVESIVADVDMNNITVSAMSNLHVALIVSRNINDRSAVEKSLQFLRAMQKIRPRGHSDIIYAAVTLADNCRYFGEADMANKVYRAVYDELVRKSDETATLGYIARNMISGFTDNSVSDSDLFGILDHALYGISPMEHTYQNTLYDFTNLTLRTRSVKKESQRLAHNLKLIAESVEIRRNMKPSAQIDLIYSIFRIAIYAESYDNPKLFDTMLAYLDKFKKSKVRSVRNAYVAMSAQITCRIDLKNAKSTEEKIAAFYKEIEAYVSTGGYLNYACNSFNKMIGVILEDGSLANDIESWMLLILRSKTNVKKLMPYVCWVAAANSLTDTSDGFCKLLEAISSLSTESKDRGFDINQRAYRRLKSSSDFCMAAFCCFLESLAPASRNDGQQSTADASEEIKIE